MEQEPIKAKVINRQMLTENVVELTIETYKEVAVLPGQWALFLWKDEQGTFPRAYSIVDQDTDNEKTMMVFVIKILEAWRGGAVVKNIHIGQEVELKGVYGHFLLKDTPFPKVFIGTGVGIAPLLNLAKYCPTEKLLLFSVSHKKDLFFEERIKKIHWLQSKIYLSQENISGYIPGRIDVTALDFAPNTEFYICGRPETANSIIEKLTAMGHKTIYTEKF